MISPRLNKIGLYAGSDIMYMNALGQSIIVIDKYETAVELLDKRSGIYSSRFMFCHAAFISQGRVTYRVDLLFQCFNSCLDGVKVLSWCPMVKYCTEIFNSAGGVTCDPFAERYFSAGLVATCDTP
jgi:hypothetical protein